MFLAELVAPTLGFLRRSDESDRLLADLEADLRTRGAIRPLISVLGAESLARYGRSFPDCVNAADEAIALAEANGTPDLASLAACSLSLAAAVIGDEEMSRRAAALLQDVPEPERRAIGPIGEAYLAYNTGRYADADARYRQIVELSPIGVGLVRWETEWIETLLRAGRRPEANAVLAELEAVVGSSTLVMHGINRTRAMLADDDDEAFARFAEAAADAKRFGNAFARGRIDLVWGERLRRARHRSEARARLDVPSSCCVRAARPATPSEPSRSCVPPAASSTTTPGPASCSPPTSCRSPASSSAGCPTANWRPGCSSARAPSRPT